MAKFGRGVYIYSSTMKFFVEDTYFVNLFEEGYEERQMNRILELVRSILGMGCGESFRGF